MGLLEDIERGFDAADRLLGVDSRNGKTTPPAPAPASPVARETLPSPRGGVARSSAKAVVIEAIGDGGHMEYIVKLGNDEAICSSPGLACRVKAMLDAGDAQAEAA